MDPLPQLAPSFSNSLPDEIISRIFVVGCWLPGRINLKSQTDRPGQSALARRDARQAGYPPRLKPFAKLVASVCIKWRSIVYWQSLYRDLYHAKISLYVNRHGFPEVLLKYLRDLNSYNKLADLEIHWECRRRVDFNDQSSSGSVDAELIRLFIHAMHLTAPAFSCARSLHADLQQPEAIDFCFHLLNDLDQRARLAHVSIFDNSFLSVQATKPALAKFSPAFASPATNYWGGCHLKSSLMSLSHLAIRYIYVLDMFILPTDLNHVTIELPASAIPFDELNSLMIQCQQLRSLVLTARIEFPEDDGETTLPDLRNLVELTLGGMSISSILTILLSSSMPELKRLCLKVSNAIGKPIHEMYALHPGRRQFVSPPELRIEFSNPNERDMGMLLPRLKLDHVCSLHLTFRGSSNMRIATWRTIPGLPALSALHLHARHPVSRISFVQEFKFPPPKVLSYTLSGRREYLYQEKHLQSWLEFSTQMAGQLSQVSEMNITIPLLVTVDDEISHPLLQLSGVERLTLSNVMDANISGIRWLEWPLPVRAVFPDGPATDGPLLATMPQLKSVSIVMDHEVTRDMEKELLREMMQALRAVLFSRKLQGHPVHQVSVVTADEDVCWRSLNPGNALEEVETFLETS